MFVFVFLLYVVGHWHGSCVDVVQVFWDVDVVCAAVCVCVEFFD